MLGFKALYPGALLLDIPGMVDCVKPLDLSRITDPGPRATSTSARTLRH